MPNYTKPSIVVFHPDSLRISTATHLSMLAHSYDRTKITMVIIFH